MRKTHRAAGTILLLVDERGRIVAQMSDGFRRGLVLRHDDEVELRYKVRVRIEREGRSRAVRVEAKAGVASP